MKLSTTKSHYLQMYLLTSRFVQYIYNNLLLTEVFFT